jgi:hypothetical protein
MIFFPQSVGKRVTGKDVNKVNMIFAKPLSPYNFPGIFIFPFDSSRNFFYDGIQIALMPSSSLI